MEQGQDLKKENSEKNSADATPDKDDFDMSHFSDEDDEGIVSNWAKKFGLLIFEVVKVVLISLAIILPIRLFLVQPFYVDGASMEPNFYNIEYLIIDEISYRFNEPQRGEVVVLKNPKDTRVYFIKRIVGLPGETVEIKDGKVSIDGKILNEAYIEHLSSQSHEALTLAENDYFVMGDNRANSYDSRTIGPVNRDYVIGRVWFRGWPLDRFNTFNLPIYEFMN